MKKRISIIISVLAAFLCFCYVLYENAQKAKKITVDESVQLLLEYIYDADYLPLCTRYDSKEDEPLMTVYNAEWVRYPVYEFEIPDDTLPIRRQIVCIGETRDREWLFFGVCLWKYYTEEEERVYRMPKYIHVGVHIHANTTHPQHTSLLQYMCMYVYVISFFVLSFLSWFIFILCELEFCLNI